MMAVAHTIPNAAQPSTGTTSAVSLTMIHNYRRITCSVLARRIGKNAWRRVHPEANASPFEGWLGVSCGCHNPLYIRSFDTLDWHRAIATTFSEGGLELAWKPDMLTMEVPLESKHVLPLS